jgi:hypothetical protein
VKTAVSFIYNFEEAVAHNVRQLGLDGVICGHIHSAAIRQLDGIAYVNCGDWVDSCTAILEHHDGRLELIDWRDGVPPGSESQAPDINDEHQRSQDSIEPAVLAETGRGLSALAKPPSGTTA